MVKFFAQKMRQLGSVLSILVQITRIKNEGLQVEHVAAWLLGNFCNVSAKNSYFNAIRITFRIFFEPCEKTK